MQKIEVEITALENIDITFVSTRGSYCSCMYDIFRSIVLFCFVCLHLVFV